MHLAVRGTTSGDSIRCDWRGIARTPEQRESAIRFWSALDEDDVIPEVAFLEVLFDATFGAVDTVFPETAESNFLAIARGGLSTEYLFLTCYADYTASEYLLGAGPTNLTVAYDRMGEAHSYELYRREHDAGQFGERPLQAQGEYESSLLEIVAEAEKSLIDRIGGRIACRCMTKRPGFPISNCLPSPHRDPDDVSPGWRGIASGCAIRQ